MIIPATEEQIISSEAISAKLQMFREFKHRQLRAGQKQALLRYHFFNQSDKKFFFLNAPPGSGKSLLGMLLLPPFRGVYLCSSKYLQDQILHDFPEAKILKGRSNYQCKKYTFLTCDACTQEKEEYKCSDCPYQIAKAAAMNAPFTILNYSYFFAEANHVGKFSKRDVIVADEADLAEHQLLAAVEINIRKSWAEKYNLPMPKFSTASTDQGVQRWIEWARQLIETLKPEAAALQAKVDDLAEDGNFRDEVMAKMFAFLKKELQQLKGVLLRLEQFTSWADSTWVFQEEKRAYSFKPTWLTGNMMQYYLGRHTNAVVFMSGTLHPPMVAPKLLGIEVADSDYLEVASTFPKERRPIYMRGVVNMSAKTWKEQMPALIDNLKRILDRQRGHRGIIHAVSYQLANAIVDGMNDPRLITHGSTDKEAVIAQFMQSPQGTVLVSPSIIRGVDLKGDMCIFTIFPKCPFLNLGDKIISARANAGAFGNMWYKSEAVQQIVQGSCRGMRHENDNVDTYIIDQKAIDLFTENVALFPMWFREAVMFV